MSTSPLSEPCRLIAPYGSTYERDTPGKRSGTRRDRIYGRLDCWNANLALPKGYAKHRVFFKDEAAAIAVGYRPCGHCLKPRHKIWKAGGEPRTEAYPRRILPKVLRPRPTSRNTTDRSSRPA